MLALVAKTPIQELHKLHPMLAEWKFLTEDHGFVSVNDGNYDLTDDGKRFVSQLDHLADHLPLHVLISGGIGTLIGALITAWNTYETYKLGENLTLEEWGCVTYDFITDNVNQVSEQAEDALDALGAIVRSINEEIDNLTNNGVATNERGDAEFTTNHKTIANSPDGARIRVRGDETTKDIEIQLPRPPEFYPETPPEFPDIAPIRELIEWTNPKFDTDVEIPPYSVDFSFDLRNSSIPSDKNNKLPTLNVRTRLSHQGDRDFADREGHRRRKDKKEFGARAYVSALSWINRTWGAVTEVLDFYNILKYHVYVERTDRYHLWETESGVGRRSGFRGNFIPLGFVPLDELSGTFDGIVHGDVKFYIKDVPNMMLSLLVEQAVDLAVALGSQAERKAIENVLGKGRGQGPLQYGNLSTWANRLNKLLEAAEKGEYKQCIKGD